MSEIHRGSKVKVRTAFDRILDRRALTGIEMGHDFQVVWVCTEDEWERSRAEAREPDGVPWPAENVVLTADRAPA